MSDNLTNETLSGGTGIAHREQHSHAECTGCGETSHILLPLADLLKAVASTLQTHPGHPLPSVTQTDTSLPEKAESASAVGNAFSQAFRSVFERTEHRGSQHNNGAHTNGDKNGEIPSSSRELRSEPKAADLRKMNPAQGNSHGSDSTPCEAKVSPISASVDSAKVSPAEAETATTEIEQNAESAHGEVDSLTIDQSAVPVSTNPEPAAVAKDATDDEDVKEVSGIRGRLPMALLSIKQRKKEQSAPPPWGDDDDNVEPSKPRFKVWQGIDGIAVMLFGVVFPALICLGAATSVPKRLTLIMLNHPVETIVELFLLALVPLTNYALWSAVRRDDMRLSIKRGIAMGSAMITSLIAAGVSFAALLQDNGQMMQTEIGTTFQAGFTWLAALSFMAAAATGYIMFMHLKARDFAKSRRLVMIYTAIGAVLSVCSFLGAEAKSWYVRMSERMAVSNHAEERADGLARLRPWYSEMEMRMECTDSRAAGVAGLFFPIKPEAQQQLYFRLTGKPFSYHDQNNDLSKMPDDYVSRHAVGDMVTGLSMVRSEMSAAVHPKTLTTSIDWTFVFRNESYCSAEARSEIGLPPGAVITGMTEWVNGQQVHGTFTATGKAQQDSTLDASTSPATIVDLGHSRALLRCSEVQPDAEVKVALRMVVPLQPENLHSASLVLPKLIARNFSLEDENAVKLYSPLSITSGFNDLHNSIAGGGINVLSGQLDGKRLQSAEVIVSVSRPDAKSEATLAVLDKLAVKLAQEDERIAASKRRKGHGNYVPLPAQLTVIVDGREGIKQQLDALSSQLNNHRDALGQRPRIKTVKPLYVAQTVTRVKSPAPKQLVIVVDGSDTMKAHAAELKKALSAVPREFPVKLLIASQDNPKLSHEVTLSQGIANLDPANFSGGQNNLRSVIDAAEDAGTVKGSAVLWIHGPQPVSNSEIYITTPYGAQPSLYELPVDSGEIDTSEFFKNHNDIGSFMQVSHRNSLSKDIASFFEKWAPNSEDYAVALTSGTQKSNGAQELPQAEGHELLQLSAYEKCMQLMADRKPRSAARIAVAYGILTPVSCLLVESQQQADQNQQAQNQQEQAQVAQQDQQQNSDAPQLQGATNGTIGPQGADATYVTGLNTAGTVRVNNLANLEAMLNLLANGSEIGAVIGALIIGISGLIPGADGKRDNAKMIRRLVIAAAIFMIGISVPGMINWLVASARDANLFS